MGDSIAVDTNVLIRYFLRDVPAQTRIADQLIASAKRGTIKIWISPWVIGELIWILSSVYNKSREFICETLRALLATSGIVIADQRLVTNALLWYLDKHIDFEDAMIALEAKRDKVQRGISFDRHFRHFGWSNTFHD